MSTGPEIRKSSGSSYSPADGYGEYLPKRDPVQDVELPKLSVTEGPLEPLEFPVLPELVPQEGELLNNDLILPELNTLYETPLLREGQQDIRTWYEELLRRYVVNNDYKEFLKEIDIRLTDKKNTPFEKAEYTAMGVGAGVLADNPKNVDYYLNKFEENFLLSTVKMDNDILQYGFWVMDALSKHASPSKYREQIKSIYTKCFQSYPYETFNWLTNGIYASRLTDHFNNITQTPLGGAKKVLRPLDIVLARDRYREVNSRFLSLGLVDGEIKPEDARRIHVYCFELTKRQAMAGKNGIKIDPFKLDKVLVGKVFGRGYTGLSGSIMPGKTDSFINRPIIVLPDYSINYSDFGGDASINSKFTFMDTKSIDASSAGVHLDSARNIARNLVSPKNLPVTSIGNLNPKINSVLGISSTGVVATENLPRGFGTANIVSPPATIVDQPIIYGDYIDPNGNRVYSMQESQVASQNLSLVHNPFHTENIQTTRDRDTLTSLHPFIGGSQLTDVVMNTKISEQNQERFNPNHTRLTTTQLDIADTSISNVGAFGNSVNRTDEVRTGVQQRVDIFNPQRTRTIDRQIDGTSTFVQTVDASGNNTSFGVAAEKIVEDITDVRNPERTVTTHNDWNNTSTKDSKFNPDGSLTVASTQTDNLVSRENDNRTNRDINLLLWGEIYTEDTTLTGIDGKQTSNYTERQTFDSQEIDNRKDRTVSTVGSKDIDITTVGEKVVLLDGSETEDRRIGSTTSEHRVSVRTSGREDVTDSLSTLQQTDHRELTTTGIETTLGQGNVDSLVHDVSTRRGARTITTDEVYAGTFTFNDVIFADGSSLSRTGSFGQTSRSIFDIRPNRTVTGTELVNSSQNSLLNIGTDGSRALTLNLHDNTTGDYLTRYNPYWNITTHSQTDYGLNYSSFEDIMGRITSSGNFSQQTATHSLENRGSTSTVTDSNESLLGTFNRLENADGTYLENMNYGGLLQSHSLMNSPEYKLTTDLTLDYQTYLQTQLLGNGTLLSHENTTGNELSIQQLVGNNYTANSTTDSDFTRVVDTTITLDGSEQTHTQLDTTYHTQITESIDKLIRESLLNGTIDYTSDLTLDPAGNSTEHIRSQEEIDAHIVETLLGIYNRVIDYEETINTEEFRRADNLGNEERLRNSTEIRHQIALETISSIYHSRVEYWRTRDISRQTVIAPDSSATVSQTVSETKYQESIKKLDNIFEEFSKEIEVLKYSEHWTEGADGTQSARAVSFDPKVNKVDAKFLKVDEDGRIRLQKAEYKNDLKVKQRDVSNYTIPQVFSHDEMKLGLTPNLDFYSTVDSVRTGKGSWNGTDVDGDKVTTEAGKTDVPELVNSQYKWLLDWNKGNPADEGKWNLSLYGKSSRTGNSVGSDLSYQREYVEGDT
ncbi:MAG: hypothetical protein WCH76_01605, partial [Candidatus Riflemargulisbacteria bacterium]